MAISLSGATMAVLRALILAALACVALANDLAAHHAQLLAAKVI